MHRGRLVFGVLFASAAGCGLLVDTDDLSGACDGCTGDGAVPVVGPDGAFGEGAVGLDAPSDDVTVVDVADSGDGGIVDGGACPGIHGPSMVRVLGFCIDSTEVTNAHYQAFLAAKGSDLSGQPGPCTWNSTYTPNYGWPPISNELSYPVAGVDWCDAAMYCQWAGKRLCGRISGGSLDYAGGNTAGQSQWFTACSHDGDGQHTYPYGNTYDASTCNNTSSRTPVMSHPGCVGGYPGIFDMSGNVAEWEDLCVPEVGLPENETPCRVRGGGLSESAVLMSCASAYQPRRDYAIAGIGIRCCSP